MTSASMEAAKDPVSSPQTFPSSQGNTGGKNAEKTFQVLEFLLEKEHYAVDLFDVREVVEYTTITHLPNTPSYMKGIIDLRGEITTILDLKERLSIIEKSDLPEENSRIIVLDEKITRGKTGIQVDDVLAVSTFERSDIDSTSATFGCEDAAILGIIKKKIRVKDRDSTELLILIDIKRLVAEDPQDVCAEENGEP